MNRLLAVIPAAALVLAACSSAPVVSRKDMTSDKNYEIARRYLDRKDYERAKTELKIILRRHPDSGVADRALLDLAKLYLETKEHIQAEHELKRLLRDYPESPLAADAQFYLGLCYYRQSLPAALDQNETGYAVEEFKLYLKEYPDGEHADRAAELIAASRDKLARKEFETARLYFRQKDYGAAAIYCRGVIGQYPDTPWKEQAVQLLGQCEIRQKDKP